MEISFNILNEGYTAEEEFIVAEHSGAIEELPERVLELADDETLESLDAGDWVTVADGELIEAGEFHPFLIHSQ